MRLEINLNFCVQKAKDSGIEKSPADVMAELGIEYENNIYRGVGMKHLFLDCKNVPDELPFFLKKIAE